MIFKLRVFLRLLQSIFGSARRTSPFLFQLIAAYFKLKFGFGTRKWSKSRTATRARNASNSSTENTENTNGKHAPGHRRSLFRSSRFSKFSLDVSRLSSKALNKVRSIKQASRNISTLAVIPQTLSMLSLPSTTHYKVTFEVPSQTPAKTVTTKVVPNMEVVQKKSPIESPEFWRSISAPLRTPVQISTSDWQVQGRKRRNDLAKKSENVTTAKEQTPEKVPLALVHTLSFTKTTEPTNAPGLFYTFENPYKVLEGLDDGAFQVPQYKQNNPSKKSQLCQPVKKPTENTTECSPISSFEPVLISKIIENQPVTALPIKIPGILPVWNSTQTLAKGPEKFATSPEPVKYSTVDADLDIARIIKNRRRQNARSPTQNFKKVPILTPTRDTVSAFRKASSPPRSVSPTSPNPQNKWQPVQKRRRRITKQADFGGNPVPDLAFTSETLPIYA